MIIACIFSAACASTAFAQNETQQQSERHTEPLRDVLADAPRVERQTLTALLESEAWPRRAIAAMRLERYDDDETRTILTNLLDDPQWQVRCFALRSLGRLRAALPDGWIADEHHPRVLRTALRHRYAMDMDRLRRGIEHLRDSSNLADKLLSAELGAASGDPDLHKQASETTKKVILRMKRTDAALSPRLAALCHVVDPHRTHLWQQWIMKQGRGFEVRHCYGVPEQGPVEPGPIAQLDPQYFSDLEQYIEQLGERDVDLAIVLDCTASMFGELAQAQGEIDDMMLFIGDMVASLRIGLVAYRDRRDDFETKGWDFTSDINMARRRLWTLTAEGGGDGPELVYDGLKMAYMQLSWNRNHEMILVLIGDAPPHVGYGAKCVEFARRGFTEAELVTHVIEADGREDRSLKHFDDIAEAGGGRRVELGEHDSLVVEITGLTLGERFKDEFSAFFRTYLELCR